MGRSTAAPTRVKARLLSGAAALQMVTPEGSMYAKKLISSHTKERMNSPSDARKGISCRLVERLRYKANAHSATSSGTGMT
jgi:hypothetical protein